MAYYGIPPGWVYDEMRGWHAPPDNTASANYVQVVDDFGNPVVSNPSVHVTMASTDPYFPWTNDVVAGRPAKPWKFCPHCGERLEAAGAPFWNPEPLYNTNEARVREAEDEGGEL